MKRFLIGYFTNTFTHAYKCFDTESEVIDFIKTLTIRDYVVLELNSSGYYVLNSTFWDYQ